MFGEDMDVITDDCQISEPSCTPDVTNPKNGEVLVPGDCGSSFAVVFFFLYLTLTQVLARTIVPAKQVNKVN